MGRLRNPALALADIHLFGNEGGGFSQKAVTKLGVVPDRPDGYRASVEDIVIEGQDSAWLRSVKRPKSATAPVLYKNIEVINGSMEVVIDEETSFGLFDIVNVANAGVSLEPGDITIISTQPGFLLRCQRPDGTAWQVDHEGRATDIPTFHTEVA